MNSTKCTSRCPGHGRNTTTIMRSPSMPKDPHEKKRKKKLAEKKRKARQAVSLAYMGEKYKKDKLIPTWMHTETGIYETYVMTDRKIFDQNVISSLESLI